MEVPQGVLLNTYVHARVDNIRITSLLQKVMLEAIAEGNRSYVVIASHEERLFDSFYVKAAEVLKQMKKSYPDVTLQGYVTWQAEIKGINDLYDEIITMPVHKAHHEYLQELMSKKVFKKLICYSRKNANKTYNMAIEQGIPTVNLYDLVYPNIAMLDDAGMRFKYHELINQEDIVRDILSQGKGLEAFEHYVELVHEMLRRCR